MSKSAAINMRTEPSQHALLTKAASVLNIDRSTFILNVACQAAQDVLLDQRIFHLNDEKFTTFEQALQQPLPDPQAIINLLKEPSPWEK